MGVPCRFNMRVFVFDTTAFLAGLQLMLHGVVVVTPPLVIEEVRDAESRSRLETALGLGRVTVLEPRADSVRAVRRVAEKIGEHISLSETDLQVAALAYELSREGCDVTVYTDDYALQNLLTHLGLKFQPLRTVGISGARRYRVICPACGYEPGKPVKRCPRCGHPLVKRRL